jgi:outer membrane protein
MKELDYLYGAGLYLQRELAGWEIGLEILQDLSGENDGQQAELSLVYPWFVEQFELRPALSLTWLSEKTVDYLFGVSAEETRVDRPAYSPGASYEIELGLLIQRPFVGDFSAVGLFEISTYGKEITDSPLVDQDYSWEGVIGVMYSF